MRLRMVGLRAAVIAGVCAGMLAWTAAPSPAAVGGSDAPLFTGSLLAVEAGGAFIQGRPFEVFATGSNEAPGGDQSDLVPYYLDMYLLSARVAGCPKTVAGMNILVKQHPTETELLFKPIPEAAAGGVSVDGPFTTPVLQAVPGFTGPMYICGYSTYGVEDAAWYEFGPVNVAAPLSASQFPSRAVKVGTTGGCWPLAATVEEQAQGISGVRHPARPMLFTFKKVGSHGITMLGVWTAMNGIWIGRGGTVIGRWHGTPDSDTTHKSPAPVSAVLLYPAGERLPAEGAHLQVGASCSSSAAL